ncbi:serine/threonine protein kinase [Actinopolymorpha alba]|uniref:serine/threonine protein kinase n=1 Tax=Actinopolymorpha alba TaxID=533267 RepID=UPI0003750A88|nr:protein kinase [Actinopolymorpha alba]
MRGEFRLRGYDVGTLLSGSATGEVWLARVQGSGEQVALKRLRLRSVQAREDARRLASVLGVLDHPHVLRVREALPYGDELVLVLDHAEGGSLDHLLNARGGLDPGEVVTAVAPIAEALAAAHERGLVHGDVTPEAILFTADGRPLLTDLGVLPLVEGGEVLATVGYTDPAAVGETGPTPAGDVYALAAVCYAALTGLVPRPGQPRRPLTDVVPDVPPGFAHAVTAGLQPLPARRPTAAQLAEMVYAACPPAPVRFPVGLVLSDSDIAAAMAAAAGDGPTSPPDPFARGLQGPGQPGAPGWPGTPNQPGGPGGGVANPAGSGPAGAPTAGPAPAGAPADPLASPMAHRAPAGTGPDSWNDQLDADDEGRGRRVGLIVAAGIGVLLVTAAVIGGVIWATRSRPVSPPTLAELTASPATSAAPKATTTPDTSTAPSPQPTRTPATTRQPTAAPPSTTPAPPPTSTAKPAPPPDGPEARWRDVLTQLDRQRAQAFAEPDAAVLKNVYTADSELRTKDAAEIEKCVDAGCKVEGLRFDIKTLDVVSSGQTRTVLRVVDQLQAYSIITASGERLDQPPGQVKTRQITLTKDAGAGWLIARIDEG